MVTAVYIPPGANVSTALCHLTTIVNKQQRAYLDGAHIIAGDFNQARLRTALPDFYQHVNCATGGKNTLDHVYSNIEHAYRAISLPNLGQSDHLSLLLFPIYNPLRRSLKPVIKTIKVWPEDALPQLQDCFEDKYWDLFDHGDLEQYCVNNITVVNNIT